jgi:hypothetical protein
LLEWLNQIVLERLADRVYDFYLDLQFFDQRDLFDDVFNGYFECRLGSLLFQLRQSVHAFHLGSRLIKQRVLKIEHVDLSFFHQQ